MFFLLFLLAKFLEDARNLFSFIFFGKRESRDAILFRKVFFSLCGFVKFFSFLLSPSSLSLPLVSCDAKSLFVLSETWQTKVSISHCLPPSISPVGRAQFLSPPSLSAVCFSFCNIFSLCSLLTCCFITLHMLPSRGESLKSSH
jgi:hypothetical protein